MRIAFFLMHLSIGGIVKRSIRLAGEFIKNGHEVDFLVYKSTGKQYYKNLVPPEVNIVEFNAHNILSCMLKVNKHLKNNKVDILISAIDVINGLLLILKRIFKYKTIFSITSCTNAIEEAKKCRGIKNKILYRINLIMGRMTYKWADCIIAISRGVAVATSQYSKVPLEKINVIYNPMIDDNFYKLMDEPPEIDDFKESRTEKIVMAAGRFTEQKNFSLLINAFADVCKNHSHVKLYLFGDGQEREKLQALIKKLSLEDRAFMPGYVNNPVKYMKNADVYVSSSNWEGFGNSILEALAAGTRIVSTDCPSGPAETLENGKHGTLVPVEDVKAMGDAILKVLNEPDNTRDQRILRSRDFMVDETARRYLRAIIKDADNND